MMITLFVQRYCLCLRPTLLDYLCTRLSQARTVNFISAKSVFLAMVETLKPTLSCRMAHHNYRMTKAKWRIISGCFPKMYLTLTNKLHFIQIQLQSPSGYLRYSRAKDTFTWHFSTWDINRCGEYKNAPQVNGRPLRINRHVFYSVFGSRL